jgi:hypothetical protein
MIEDVLRVKFGENRESVPITVTLKEIANDMRLVFFFASKFNIHLILLSLSWMSITVSNATILVRI